jgi:hypothetical protein
VHPTTTLPRLRQAVVAAKELDAVVERLQQELGLGEPFSDPAVAFFGLRNAVFALGDSFLEVVSPVAPDTAAGRQIQRQGGDCGYMLMFQIDDFADARERARAHGIREVFEIAREDIDEVHLHPGDMRGAIVSLSRPQPPATWPWGGPDWQDRATPARVVGATVAVSDPDAAQRRWRSVIGDLPRLRFEREESNRGLVEVVIATSTPRTDPVNVAGVRFRLVPNEEDR